MPTSNLSVQARWSKPVVADSGGDADLLVRITAGPAPARNGARAPLDVAFVIDRSGSMSGEKLEVAKDGVRVALDRLDPRDRAAVVVYDDRIDLLHELAPVTRQTKSDVKRQLGRTEARGSTNLGGGWLTGCRQIARDAGNSSDRRLRRTIVLTDGLANVGIVSPAELAHHAGELRARGVTTTTLGFGDDFDEQLLTAMAEAGGGNFEYIAHARQLVPFFTRELGELLNAAAIGLTLRLTLPHGVRGEVISRLPHERAGKTFEIAIGDLPGGESVDLLMQLTAQPGAAGDLLPVGIEASWIDPAGDRESSWTGGPAPLMRTSAANVVATAADPEVAEKAALQRTADAHREAMLLDRQGRHAESRARLLHAQAVLAAAPPTDRIAFELNEVANLAVYSSERAFNEATHKRTASRASRMGRGRRDREENLGQG